MATLKQLHNQSSITLNAHHLIGRRQPTVDLHLEAPDTSLVHAAIRWNGSEWHIEDLSRNGTWVNQRKLVRNKHYALQPGMTIQFGRASQSTWQVEDLSAPVARLEPIDKQGEPVILELGALLPNETHPEMTIFMNAQGNWVCESAHDLTLLEDGQLISAGTKHWLFRSNQPDQITRDDSNSQNHSNNTLAVFHVSQCEEHVSLKLTNGTDEFDLNERIHHYLLLTLARQRLEDIQQGLDPDAQGWVDMPQLTRMLGIDDSHANIQVYRARRQLMKCSPDKGLDINIVERRSGDLRFGLPHIQVQRGSTIENESIGQQSQHVGA